jgi:hypothetical protein
MKNSNDTIGNRTRDLPVCSAVSQPIMPPRAPPPGPRRDFFKLFPKIIHSFGSKHRTKINSLDHICEHSYMQYLISRHNVLYLYTINQQTHYSNSLLMHSTAATCFDVYASSSGNPPYVSCLHQQFKAYRLRNAPSLTFNNCTLCPHRIYVFCIYLRNSDVPLPS